MKLTNVSFLPLIVYLFISSCSLLKNDNSETKIRNFLSTFQSSLKKSDDHVLKYFRVNQSREALITAIQVLRNSDTFVVCDINFSSSIISIENDYIDVKIPIVFQLQDLGSKDSSSTWINMKLVQRETEFFITEFNGEELYQAFNKIKNRYKWEAIRELALRERKYAYDLVGSLRNSFDSIIWFTSNSDRYYFYVVNGSWINTFHITGKYKNTIPETTRMGLVDEKGEIIIPVSFDLIGTISFIEKNLVEVKRAGKIGYYDIAAKSLVIDTLYNLIVPYQKDNIWAIAKNDSTYGWLDNQYVFTPGFPSSEVENWFNNFTYLKKNIKLTAGNQAFCEIPNPEYAGNGIVIPPSYLVEIGVFNEIEGYISTTGLYSENAGYEFKETRGSFFKQLKDNLSILIVSFRDRYLDGREEFYTSSSLKIINEEMEVFQSYLVHGEGISLNMIDSTLIEVKSSQEYWFEEYESSRENNLQRHTYFKISSEGSLEELKSRRLYQQTQFVKLDSSYMIGEFKIHNHNTNQTSLTNFLSVQTITFMRNEILADYGFNFPNSYRTKEQFQYTLPNYKPKYSSLDEFETELSDIDRHNLVFLNSILSVLREKNPEMGST